jgi:hypothetical protein
MKRAVRGLLILSLVILFPEASWTDQGSPRTEKLLYLMILLPADEEIPGWKRTEKILQAAKDEDLYRIMNGGATLYIQHGFRSFMAQSYKRFNGAELEVLIFDQSTAKNTEDLYTNPFAKPNRIKEIADLGGKARLDMTPLFCYGVDFIQKRFFVRVIVQDRTEEGLSAAISFARFISSRIR